MPQPKKDASVRRRANKATTAATLDRIPQHVPDMPSGLAWHAETLRWWDDVWSSPMSPEWDDSDIHNVIICAMLYNDIWTAETAKERKDAASEFRLQRKDLGLTPYDRRRLEWTIATAGEATDRGKARREASKTSPQPQQSADPRLVLVQDGSPVRSA